MSIGNLKDYGNKGNNFPFQLKTLQGLSLSQFSKIESAYLSDPSMIGLEIQLNALYIAKSTYYLISQNIFYDPTTNEFASLTTYSKP